MIHWIYPKGKLNLVLKPFITIVDSVEWPNKMRASNIIALEQNVCPCIHTHMQPYSLNRFMPFPSLAAFIRMLQFVYIEQITATNVITIFVSRLN